MHVTGGHPRFRLERLIRMQRVGFQNTLTTFNVRDQRNELRADLRAMQNGLLALKNVIFTESPVLICLTDTSEAQQQMFLSQTKQLCPLAKAYTKEIFFFSIC